MEEGKELIQEMLMFRNVIKITNLVNSYVILGTILRLLCNI